MPIAKFGPALAAALLALSPALAAPAAAPVLDGWGSFKFGMSPEKARAVPGQDFGRFSAKNLLNQNDGAMSSKKPVPLYGVPYSLDLHFGSFESLRRISMWHEQTTSQADCETAFLTLLSRLQKDYGKFLPIYPEQKKNDQDQLPMSVAWKPGYQLATAYLAAETAYVWSGRAVFGARYIDAAAVWSAGPETDRAVCLTEVEFTS